MEKIRKTYTVGSETFSTYAEAVAARRRISRQGDVDLILKTVDTSTDWRDPSAIEIVIALLDQFTIKPRKAPK